MTGFSGANRLRSSVLEMIYIYIRVVLNIYCLSQKSDHIQLFVFFSGKKYTIAEDADNHNMVICTLFMITVYQYQEAIKPTYIILISKNNQKWSKSGTDGRYVSIH